MKVDPRNQDQDTGPEQTNGTSRNGGSPGPSLRHGPGPQLMSATTLIGDAVCSRSGDNVGEIKEIMLDMRSGRISYAVMAFGGFLGMGDKLFAVPWDALTLDPKNKRFGIDVNREHLSSAPGFNKDQWPDMADATWVAQIHDYYGIQPRRSTNQV